MIVAAYLNLSGQIENRIPEDNNNVDDANIDIQELPSLHAHGNIIFTSLHAHGNIIFTSLHAQGNIIFT